jgi:CubicO group peptidase (beta-lactamase class C family)
MTGAELLGKLSSLPLVYQPGAVWEYGFGLDVLGLIVESISQEPLGQYLTNNVWRPLGMTDTGFGVPAEKIARYAKALANDPETGRPQPARSLTHKFDCGGGCAVGTAGDYVRFAQMLLNKGKYGDTRILARKTVEYMLSNQLGPEVKNLIGNADPTKADYGFGLGLAVQTTPGIVPMAGDIAILPGPARTAPIGGGTRRRTSS